MSTKSSKNLKRRSFQGELKERFGNRYQSDQNVRDYFGHNMGGVADHFVVVENSGELVDAAKIAYRYLQPFIVVGSGFSTLVSDYGFSGLVIMNRAQSLVFDHDSSLVLAESGVTNSQLVSAAASRGLGGLEFLILIKGSVGGSIVTNATYQENSLNNFLKELTLLVFEGRQSKIEIVPVNLIKFEPYWSSFLSPVFPKPVVISAKLQFARIPQEEIMKRISVYRNSERIKHYLLGSVFKERLCVDDFDKESLKELFSGDVRLDKKSPDLLWSRKRDIQPTEVDRYLRKCKRIFRRFGQELTDRLTKVGRWSEEGDEKNET